jgi:hypothetical protein
MEQEIDEVNKIIHIKCTEKEKQKLILETAPYLYDYQLNFILLEDNTDQK